ncbi:FAD-dependent oxidoreductase [Rhizobium sp. NLR8a]|uniref:NAD(P)/FAD-dependent oxidoreductase n=1 Tax=Rhizobium sp. NLR8a TaxID=2731119 RepID=UPI001C82D9AB|nr:FAD/NAD(P)-binding oxidoreductase [Rhizobium sp. NLR8a]MBX5218757.1 FAD-dependent oxidoreductase [Rhizobium sp. NLR8a]
MENKNPTEGLSPLPDADVLVIGAGPAGMSAAVDLATAGCRVIVLDMQPSPGGQIFRSIEANHAARPVTDRLLEALGRSYAAGLELVEQFRATPGIDYRPDTTVWEVRADGTVGWLKGTQAGYLRASRIVLANGAMERPMPFPGWTLPGVFTAGAVQTLIKAGRLQPEGRIVLAGTGPLILLLAEQLRRLGVRPLLIARTDTLRNKLAALSTLKIPALPALVKGLGWIVRLKMAGIPMPRGISNLRAHGTESVESVSMDVRGKRITLPCDMLIVHDGVIPCTDLAHGAGLALDWLSEDRSWRPKTSSRGQAEMAPGPALTSGPCRIFVSGDARGIGGADAATAHGRYVAATIVQDLGMVAQSDVDATGNAVRVAMAGRPFIDAAFPPGLSNELPEDETIVCRCEELDSGTLRKAIRGGADDMNLVRGLLRCGMGPCQGRHCSITLARLLTEEGASDRPHPPFRARPPLRPIPLGALANLSGLDPELAEIVSLGDKPEANSEEDAHE